MSMYCGKMADLIEMPVRMVGWLGIRYNVLDGGQDPPREAILLGGMGWCNVMYMENVSSSVQNWLNWSSCRFDTL